MLYTSNLKFGWTVLETKMSLLILPLIYAAYIDTTKDKIQEYLKYLVYGCIVYAIICLTYAGYAFFKPVLDDLYGDIGSNNFYYSYLSLYFHPSYTAMYSVFSLLIISIGIKKRVICFNWKIILSITLLIIFILLLSSKAGWFILILLGLYVFKLLISLKKGIKILYFVIPILVLFLALNVYFTPKFSHRLPQIENIIKAITGKDQNDKTVTTGNDGNASRVFIWKASYELFLENFLTGTGTGDAKDELLKKYQEKKMTNEFQFQLNSHNQFLSTSLYLGLLGLITFLFMLFYPLIISIKHSNYVLVGFILLIIINLMVESMFEKQAGLVFYAFFNTLLCSTLVKINSN